MAWHDDAGISEFDEIEFSMNGKPYRGIVLPSMKGMATIKLSSGYNINVLPERLKFIRKTGRHFGPESRNTSPGSVPTSNVKAGMVLTGGTIASKVDYRTGGVHGLASADELLEMVPEVGKFAVISDVSSPISKMSEDIELSDYPVLAKEIYRMLKNNDAVIVLHGTDTMHFSSSAMSFMLKTGKPVIFVGSQRSSDRPSTDAWMNLICSAVVAGYDISGVGICMHGSISDDYCFFNPGAKTRKMHTSRRDAFRPINAKPWMKVWPDGRVEELSLFQRRSDELELDNKISNMVSMVETYPSADPEVLDFYAERGAKGIIIKATALGHVPTFSSKSWVEKIKALSKDIFIGITSQTLYGSTNPYVYTNLRLLGKSGATFLGNMLPETAYVKLAWALGHTEDAGEVRKIMLNDIAGEISDREEPDTFLY